MRICQIEITVLEGIKMNALLRKIIESEILATHQDNEQLILDRNEAVMKSQMLSKQICANIEFMEILKKELVKDEISRSAGP